MRWHETAKTEGGGSDVTKVHGPADRVGDAERRDQSPPRAASTLQMPGPLAAMKRKTKQ